MGQQWQDDLHYYCDECGAAAASGADLCPECLAQHYRDLLANPAWLSTSGRVKHPLTGVPEADRVRADLDALTEQLDEPVDEPVDEEREARQAEQDAYDMHVDAAIAAAGGRR